MSNLSHSDRAFYAKEDSWIGGPIFQLRLVFEEELSGEELSDFLIESLDLLLWEKKSITKQSFKTIVSFDDNFSFGMRHSYYFSKRKSPYFLYSLGIRPPQLIRLINYYPDISESKNPCNWDEMSFEKMNKIAFKRIIDFFTLITFKVRTSFPLKYATISDETKPWVFPGKAVHKEGLYFDKDFEFVFPITGTELSSEFDKLFIYQPFSSL